VLLEMLELLGAMAGIGGLRVTKPVGPKNLLNQLNVSSMIEEVAFKAATTWATGTLGRSKRGIQISVKLSSTTYELFTIPDELDAASPKNVWRASKYCTYQRTQSFHCAFVHAAGLGLY